jgi:hypothetical protein
MKKHGYLKELSTKLGGKIHSQDLFDINFDDQSSRKLVVKNYKNYKLEIEEFGKIYFIKIKVNSDFTLSINNPNRLSPIDQEIDVNDTPYKLYILKESYNSFIKGHRYNPFLSKNFRAFWEYFIITINDLNLFEYETVSIREDYIGLSLDSNRNIIPIIDDIIELISSNEKIFKKTIKLDIKSKNIPENLRPLFPLLKKWSIGDDVDREQLIEETGENQKKKLVSTVYPFMKEINEYLDSFRDEPLTEEAMLIGNLAELVSELKIAPPD